MSYLAAHKFARISSTKVRPFATLIRGRTAADGLSLLRYQPNRAARMLEKVLKSAMANAENQGERNVEHFVVVDAHVNEGPMFKRMHARARGMAFIIRRRFAHIHISIDQSAAAAGDGRSAAGKAGGGRGAGKAGDGGGAGKVRGGSDAAKASGRAGSASSK